MSGRKIKWKRKSNGGKYKEVEKIMECFSICVPKNTMEVRDHFLYIPSSMSLDPTLGRKERIDVC